MFPFARDKITIHGRAPCLPIEMAPKGDHSPMAPHLSMESPSIESPARELAGSWRHYALAPIVSPPSMGVISPYVDYYILGAIRAPSWLCIYLFRDTARVGARTTADQMATRLAVLSVPALWQTLLARSIVQQFFSR